MGGKGKMKCRKLLVLSVIGPPLAIAAPALGYQSGGRYGPGVMYGWGGSIFSWLIMLLFVIVVIALLVTVVRWITGTGHRQAQPGPAVSKTPMDILKERFARGEIDKAEFEERKHILSD